MPPDENLPLDAPEPDGSAPDDSAPDDSAPVAPVAPMLQLRDGLPKIVDTDEMVRVARAASTSRRRGYPSVRRLVRGGDERG